MVYRNVLGVWPALLERSSISDQNECSPYLFSNLTLKIFPYFQAKIAKIDFRGLNSISEFNFRGPK